MSGQISAKNTKAQILEAYDRLTQEYGQLQSQRDRLLGDKKTLEQKLGAAAPAAAPGEYTIDVILAGLASLRAGLGSAVKELSAKLTARAAELAALRQSIAGKTAQLAQLYDLTVTPDTLDQLIQTYTETSSAFQAQMAQKRAAFEQEIGEKRAAWKQEQQNHTLAVKERDARLKKERQRSEQEFKYNLDIERKRDAEQYEQAKKERRRALEAFIAAKEQAWAEREQTIAAQEQEYRTLQDRVSAFPDELEAAVKRAEKEGVDLARKQAKIQDDLLAKEEQGSSRLAKLKIQALQEAIDRQQQQIALLSAQLDAVIKQSQTLAEKAIEGASRETSFQSIREIALEQAKRPPQGQ